MWVWHVMRQREMLRLNISEQIAHCSDDLERDQYDQWLIVDYASTGSFSRVTASSMMVVIVKTLEVDAVF